MVKKTQNTMLTSISNSDKQIIPPSIKVFYSSIVLENHDNFKMAWTEI